MTRGEAARKAVHIGAGLLALLVPWLAWWQGVLICLGAFLFNWKVLPVLTHRLLWRDEDREKGYAAGIMDYPLAVGGLFLLFGSRPAVVAAAWGILAFGDGLATLVGRSLGGPRLPWNAGKTLSGFVAFATAGGLAAAALALWATSRIGPVAAGVAAGSDTTAIVLACFAAALLGALVETYPSGVDDNITVPILTGGFLFGLSFARPAVLAADPDRLVAALLPAVVVNLVISGLAWAGRTVKTSGAIVGFLIGTAVYTFGGWRSFVILMLFFVLATSATKVGYEQKAARRIAQEEGGRRGARHAVANCGVPAFLAFLAAATPFTDLMIAGLVAALATAVFDTVSSEIGQVYGKRPFLITTLRPVPPGTEGAVSVEGTAAGLAAAIVLAVSAFALGMTGSLGAAGAAIVVLSAFVGSTAESLAGAWARIDNEAMNFANTLVGAVCAVGLCTLVL